MAFFCPNISFQPLTIIVLDIEGSLLKYGMSYDGAGHKSIDLSGYDPDTEKDQYNWLNAASVPKSRSFAVNIAFS